ncbi:LysR substrate-binding domain-containing protein [Bordetella sp. 2513F-2]
MRRLPPLTALVAFECAARHASFQRASEELNLTPSAISHQVKNLESWFGKELFLRHTRRVTLTEEARSLLRELTPALDRIDEACAALQPSRSRAQLAIHSAPSFAAKWLNPRLPRLMQDYPDVTFRLSSGPEPVDLSKAAQIDVHISYGHAPLAPGVCVTDLGEEITAPLVSPRLLQQAKGPVTPEWVTQWVLIDSQLSPVRWSDWCRQNHVKLPARPRPSFDRGLMAVSAAADGMGVALETVRFAEQEIQRGELVALDGPGFIGITQKLHFLCYREADRNNPVLGAFVAWLRRELDG